MSEPNSISYFQDYKITEIIPRLWVSNRLIAERDATIIREKGIGAIVSLVEEYCEPLPDVETLHCPVTDGNHIPAPILDKIFSFVQSAMQNTNVLIYCSAGVSRSAGIAMGVIMAQKNCSWEQAHDLFNRKRFSWVCPEIRESVQGYFSEEGCDFLISLNGKKLEHIPEVFFEMPKLKELHLNNNRISRLPETIHRMKNLMYLNLAANRLVELPEDIGKLCHLRALNLHSNQLRVLPENMGNLGSLISLSLGNNLLTRLPGSITRLHQLQRLNIGMNKYLTLTKEQERWLCELKANDCLIIRDF